MSYFKRPTNAISHKRILSQSFYKNAESNDYRFTHNANARVTPEPQMKCKTIMTQEQPNSQKQINQSSVIRTEGPNDISILSHSSFNQNTLKKSHPMQQVDFQSLNRQSKTDLNKFHNILEEKNEQVQEWMSRYLALEQKLDADLQQYKEEFFYQSQLQFRKKQDELNILKLNLKNEKQIMQEELNSSSQRLQLVEAENRQLLQQLKNQQAFSNTQLYKDLESVKGKQESQNNKSKLDTSKLEEIIETQGQKIKEQKIQMEYLKHQNEHQVYMVPQEARQEQDNKFYVQQIDAVKNQLNFFTQEKSQLNESVIRLQQEALESKNKEKNLQDQINELNEQLKKKQELIDKLRKNGDDEIEEIQQTYESRKLKDMQAICKLMQDKKDLIQDSEQKKQIIQDFQTQIDGFQNEVQSLKERFVRRQSDDDQDEKFQDVQKNFDERFNSMQAYYDRLKKDNEDEVNRLNDEHNKHINSLKNQLDALRKQLQESQRDIFHLEQQSDSNEKNMINELSQLKIINRDLTDQFEHYENQIRTLYSQLDEKEKVQKTKQHNENELIQDS